MKVAERLAALPEGERAAALAEMSAAELEALHYSWEAWARANQLEPAAGNDGTAWNNWLILAGRGFGKTRTGAEWTRKRMCGKTPLAAGRWNRMAIIGETSKDVRDVLVEGESGLLACHPKDFRPHYEPSKNKLTWPNGAVATLYNGTEPDQLRGPQFMGAWVDELAKYRYAQETWDMLMFGLRLGDHPQAMVTTTPRPIKLIKALMGNPKTAVTIGSTFDNAENLAATFLQEMRTQYEGTRLGRQELSAELLEDDPNALWRRDVLDANRRRTAPPDMRRILVAVDPAAKSRETQVSEGGAETGIIVAGLASDDRGYVLDDLSTTAGPNDWARRAVSAYDRYEADAIVAEINNGGDMVESVIKSVRPNVRVIKVTASRGKVARAEPVSALYEQARISHVGTFGLLEDQMCSFNNLTDQGTKLKDRVDALVWALTELFPQMVKRKREKYVDKWSFRPRSWMG